MTVASAPSPSSGPGVGVLDVAERVAARRAAPVPWARDELLQSGRVGLVGLVALRRRLLADSSDGAREAT